MCERREKREERGERKSLPCQGVPKRKYIYIYIHSEFFSYYLLYLSYTFFFFPRQEKEKNKNGNCKEQAQLNAMYKYKTHLPSLGHQLFIYLIIYLSSLSLSLCKLPQPPKAPNSPPNSLWIERKTFEEADCSFSRSLALVPACRWVDD